MFLFFEEKNFEGYFLVFSRRGIFVNEAHQKTIKNYLPLMILNFIFFENVGYKFGIFYIF